MNKLKIVFIAGASRSGSTLLDLIISKATGGLSLGELHNIWERGFVENQLCGCGKPFKSCVFWRAVVNEAFGGIEKVDIEEILDLRHNVERIKYYIPRPQLFFEKMQNKEFRDNLNKYIEIYSNLYNALSYISGKEIIIDSSKWPTQGLIVSYINNIDLYLIHLVRDSRAVAFSNQRAKLKPEIYWKKAYFGKVNTFKSSRDWILTNLLTELLSKKVKKSIRIRYEDLVRKPKDTLINICKFIGVEDASLDIFNESQDILFPISHTVSGNPIRFSRKLIIKEDVEWRTKMPMLKKFIVTALTWPLLLRYGYFQ